MLNKVKTGFGIFVAVSVSFFSCKNNSPETIQKHSIALNFPDSSQYYYNITNSTITTATHNEKEIETTNKAEIGLLYQISKDSSGNYLLKLTYDKLIITRSNQGGIQIIDASKGENSPDPVEKVLSNIRGSTLLVTMQPDGKVLQITGSKEIADKILGAISPQEAMVRQAVEKQITQLVGDEFIQNSIAGPGHLLPDSAIHVGDSWTRTTEQNSGVKFSVDTKYTLESVADSIAHIEMKSDIDDIIMNENSGLNAAGFMVTTNLKGKQTGTIKMDMASGMMVSEITNTNIKGTMQVAGNEVPLTIQMKKEVSTKKI